MRRTVLCLAAAAAFFLSGCSEYTESEVTPLDDGQPVPECVSVRWYTYHESDGRETDQRAAVYCLDQPTP